MTLSAQAEQVESETDINDPVTPVATAPMNLVQMEEMTKEALLDAVRIRFENQAIYTFVADILVAANPYKWFDMYGKKYKERYNPSSPVCQVPHVYAIAQSAAKNLRLLNRNQVCIISGESGAGKTECAKLFMHHLLTYSNGSADSKTSLEKQILESQPLLEAFGNAKTGLNDNSSRFGKYIEVQFQGMDKVLGASVKKYLLEKSRVVSQVEGERNFHVFYYLTEGAPKELRDKLNVKDCSYYRYLNTEKVSKASEWFNELDKSMRLLGFTEEEIMSLWQSLAAILKTGQMEFEDIEGSVDDSCTFVDKALAQDLADSLGVSCDTLENALTTRHVVVVGETMHRPLNAVDSAINRDIMAMNLYDNLFSWLTDHLNTVLVPDDEDDCKSVAVLDIFGFENFKVNRFEQMFINTANEKLQHYFIEHIFTYEVRELREEGIKAPAIEYTNNEDQVDVLLGKRGIFALLDEQTKVPNSTDTTAILKMHEELSSKQSYDNIRNSPVQFQINHYAGNVKYEIEGCLEKNRNTPSLGIAGMLKSSSNAMISSLFKSSETTEERLMKDKQMSSALKTGDQTFFRRESQAHRFGKSKEEVKKVEIKKNLAPWQIKNMQGPKKPEVKAPKIKRAGSEKRRAGLGTLSAAFKGSLEDLMIMLNAATPHFIRCIKPNLTKSSMGFDPVMVQSQLNYTGVLETSKIRQNGYPLRVTYEDFCERYRDVCINPTYRLASMDMQSTCLRILQHADLHGWGKGKSKIFLKYEHVNVLVNILESKKRAGNEARAKIAAEQAKRAAELAVIEAKREVEREKIRKAAEAQPKSKVVESSLNWKEEMEANKEKKRLAAIKKKEDAEAAEKQAELDALNKPVEIDSNDEAAQARARFAANKNMFK